MKLQEKKVKFNREDNYKDTYSCGPWTIEHEAGRFEHWYLYYKDKYHVRFNNAKELELLIKLITEI